MTPTLSGLAQHPETGSCQGGLATFKAIKHVKKQLEVLDFAGAKLLLDY
jgi:hypothetical protein